MSIYPKGTVLASLSHMLVLDFVKPPKTCVTFDLHVQSLLIWLKT